METKKLIPYSIYLPPDHYRKLKAAAKNRKASSMVRDAIAIIIEGNDAFKTGYNKGIKDAAKIIYDNEQAQMVAIKGKDLGAVLTEQIESLSMK